MSIKTLFNKLNSVKEAVKNNKVTGSNALEKVANIVYIPETNEFSDDLEHNAEDNNVDYKENMLDNDNYTNKELNFMEDSSNTYFDTDDPTAEISSETVIDIINGIIDDVKMADLN